MGRTRTFAILLGAAAAAAAVVRHGHGAAKGRRAQGGILIGDVVAYDAMSRLVLGSLFGPIAADAAEVAEAVAPDGTRVLEVGCGPGHLSIRLARQHGLDVTGLDLDPAMIERARANADRAGDERLPSFLVGDVASMPFRDRSFDLVVSTSRCTIGPIRQRAWPRSTACCALAPGHSSGTSDPVSSHSTAICSIRSSTRMALRFAWWA